MRESCLPLEFQPKWSLDQSMLPLLIQRNSKDRRRIHDRQTVMGQPGDIHL